MKKNIKLYNVSSKIKKVSVIGASEPDEDRDRKAFSSTPLNTHSHQENTPHLVSQARVDDSQ
ncbi:MAG TPA: hypothetical protein EYP82_02465, partial [Hydrogenothermaceae bacterium]|nr:hypothetical protein [Hydrogenothermaceae bacterium]